MSSSNIGAVDLESVLNVRRRTLVSIDETSLPHQPYRYVDTIYLKRQDKSNSLLSIDSKILIFGELQFLCHMFERYTAHINVYEESKSNNDNSTTNLESKLSKTSIKDQCFSTSPTKTISINPIPYVHTLYSTTNDHSTQNLEGKHYGCIELPNMKIIEIIEIILRSGLELVNESNYFDKENVLHQNFVFSKACPTHSKHGPSYYGRSASFIGSQEKLQE